MISLYRGGIKQIVPSESINSEKFVELIKSNTYREQIQKIQQAKNKDERNKLKLKLDYVTPGGTFKTRSNDNLIEHSKFLHLDIDNIPESKIKTTKDSIISSKYTHIAHLSPSGNGFKVWVRIPQVKDDNAYKCFYEAVMKEYNLPKNIDSKTKDISRACFVSWDPNIYYNSSSAEFTKQIQQPIDTMNFINVESDIIPILVRNWKEPNRNQLAVATVGTLRKLGYGYSFIKSVIEKICKLSNDKEVKDRIGTISPTFKKNEDEIIGISGLKVVLIEEDYKKLLEILNRDEVLILDPDEDDTESLPDMLNREINMDYIIEDLIYPESLIMLYSPPANLKTMVAYFMALSISSGSNFINRKVRKGNVLFLDLENDNKTRKLRLPRILNGLEVKEEECDIRFKYFINLMDGKQKINTNSVKLLENLIIKYNTKVLFIDTLHRSADYKENNADDINQLYNKVFKKLIDKYKISIVFLHHANKMGGYRGSTDLLGIANISLQVLKNGDTMEFSLVNQKDRNNEVKAFLGKITETGESMTMTKINELTKGSKSSKTELLIKEFLRFGEKSREEIIGEIDIKTDGTVSKATVKKVLSSMKSKVVISSRMNGKKSMYKLAIEEPIVVGNN